MKKLISLCLALVLVLAMAAPAMAISKSKSDSGNWTDKSGVTYTYYCSVSVNSTSNPTSSTATISYAGTDQRNCILTNTIELANATVPVSAQDGGTGTITVKAGNTTTAGVTGDIIRVNAAFYLRGTNISTLTLS